MCPLVEDSGYMAEDEELEKPWGWATDKLLLKHLKFLIYEHLKKVLSHPALHV